MQDNAITLARKMLCVSGERKQTTFKPTINTQDCLVTLFHCNDVVFFFKYVYPMEYDVVF